MSKKLGNIAIFMAGALLLTSAAAQAQQSGPVYFTPKIMYSRQTTDDFTASQNVSVSGISASLPYSGSKKSDNSFGGGFAVGYDFGTAGYLPVRAELEYLIRSRSDMQYPTQYTDLSGGDYLNSTYDASATVQTLFANLYYDFNTDTAFTPYIGAGLGGANVKGELKIKRDGKIGGAPFDYSPANGSHNAWNFAWNLSVGTAYSLTDNISLDLSYRYSDMGAVDYGTHGYYLKNFPGDSNYNGTAEADLTSHEVILGLRFYGF